MNGFTHESTYNESKEWYTPREIFNLLNIQFDLDPCSPGKDIVPWIPANKHYTTKEDGLVLPWYGNVFVNPPYGSDTPVWMEKLNNHGLGIALVFARTDTKWFHAWTPKADGICFIKGRISFVPQHKAHPYSKNLYTPKGGCGAASMLIAFGKNNLESLKDSKLGLTLEI